ncbi:hypothetical protein TVAG_026210 [Trichomonas vaginalis G3]|uniref:Vps41 beta-propeller domain-containing protein n=1 Tax=Trichomonas vaginalis (strain ATCC PRA-98 / G3) TaxID=412133 RepID=A2DZ24_TRIV3|nr:WD40 repeat-like family [Trichomonas vaginalis G3]EAY14300.1 hypothetical protein TVAG_026210 [Trichomonas vaginalis G3]KAI5517327.1 WD40 repeat-like family [Trichomonas vaginalis G3]|eukprot:XP_001326523.1 hypothetical protein [Trichomonas vaginalis G3]
MKIIMTASDDHTIGIFDRENQDNDIIEAHESPITDIKISPDGTLFATASTDRTTKLWNFSTKETIFTTKTHKQSVSCVSWFQDSSKIATGSHDGSVILWDAKECERLLIMNGINGWVNDVQVHGDLVAMAGNDRNIIIYDQRTGKAAQKISTRTETDISSLSFHHLGSCLAASSNDNKIRMFDLRTTNIVRRQRAHCEGITRVSFNPNTDDYLTVSKDGFVRLWSLKSSDIITSFQQHDSGVNNVTWCSDGKHFATCGDDRKICVWYQSKENEEDFDGGDVLSSLNTIQQQLRVLTSAMKRLDERLLIQEGKVRFLQDIDRPIVKAYLRASK